MTDLSPAHLPRNASPRGSLHAMNSMAQGFSVPPAIVRALNLDSGLSSNYNDQIKSLSRAKHEGFLDVLPSLADKAAVALAPVEMGSLIDRLTMLGMSMANGRDADQIKAWLHETARLLSDLPQDVLFEAIDECVKEPGRVFAPSVGEIREKAATPLKTRERRAARLRNLANLIAEGVEIPDWQPPAFATPTPAFREEDRCTPEEAAAILKEFGIKSSLGDHLANYLKPEQPKSRADHIAAGREPPPLRPTPPSSWEMMP